MEQHSTALKEGQYFSIALPVDHEILIKRSRFIASLRCASDRREFDENLKRISMQYPGATHHCWAYRFDTKPITEHSSDAGEPQGTAGRPILGSLKKYSLLNIMAVVTRYYGGIKLGVSGLISAYGETTLSAVKKAEIIIREHIIKITFKCPYNLYNELLRLIKRYEINANDIKAVFTEDISGEIIFPKSLGNIIINELEDISFRGKNFSYSITEQ
jgi:uncharacterized YigZ family protein